jgi:hypothetical protein
MYYDEFTGTAYRYGATLRPFNQLNLARLEYLFLSDQADPSFPRFGTAAFARKLTDFEVSQFDLTFVSEENRA